MEFEGWSHSSTNYNVQKNRLHVCMNMGIWKVVPSWTHNLLIPTSLHMAALPHIYHLLCSTHSHNMEPFTTRVDGISCCMTTNDRPHSSVLSHHGTVQCWSGWHQLPHYNKWQAIHCRTQSCIKKNSASFFIVNRNWSTKCGEGGIMYCFNYADVLAMVQEVDILWVSCYWKGWDAMCFINPGYNHVINLGQASSLPRTLVAFINTMYVVSVASV